MAKEVTIYLHEELEDCEWKDVYPEIPEEHLNAVRDLVYEVELKIEVDEKGAVIREVNGHPVSEGYTSLGARV